MEKIILSVNTGSASKKYAFFSRGKELLRLHMERENEGFICTARAGETEERIKLTEAEYKNAPNYLLLYANVHGILNDSEIVVVGVRIVAPGHYFFEHAKIDERFIKKLKEAEEAAPLHVGPALLEIKALQNALPGVPLVAVSDSAFHITMPPEARIYALSKKAADLGIYRYGYHGISVKSAVKKAEKLLGHLPGRIIVCHLGSGSSVTAVQNGESLDTSMGFTPLEGVPMGTRAGDVDAGAVIYLGEKLKLNYRQLEEYLNEECGLLGLSGKTNDVRELLSLEKKKDPGARFALRTFVYRIQKYIGAYVAALGGLDLLVFTATIGERSAIMRERILDGLGCFGLSLDENKNRGTDSADALINAQHSKAKIAVLVADELKEIAEEVSAVGVV